MKFKDRRKTKSVLVSFVPGESFRERHHRRLEFNLAAQEWVREQAVFMGLRLKIANEGHHWQFRGEFGFKADWWPSSAKLVIMERWKQGIHVHDYEAATEEIRKALAVFAGKKKKPSARKLHYCFHCHTDKPIAEFKSPGCTWCIPCQNE